MRFASRKQISNAVIKIAKRDSSATEWASLSHADLAWKTRRPLRLTSAFVMLLLSEPWGTALAQRAADSPPESDAETTAGNETTTSERGVEVSSTTRPSESDSARATGGTTVAPEPADVAADAAAAEAPGSESTAHDSTTDAHSEPIDTSSGNETSSEPTLAPSTMTEGPGADIPIRFGLHGYYRARFNWIGNVPTRSPPTEPLYRAENANFAFQRLRLNPEIKYGSDPERPIAALYMQIDAMDNAVLGDNARVTRTPLFAADPSYTDYEGFDLADSFRLERVWLEFLVPVGQIRVGRMPSHWGLGLLAHDGNGLGEWGDPLFGTSFDRVLFATRPMTIANFLLRGDSRPTPLIYAIAFDKLVEDPVRPGIDPPEPGSVRIGAFGPLGTVYNERPVVPFAAWVDDGNDIQEVVNAVIWSDSNIGLRETDQLRIGLYHIYRWQRNGRVFKSLPTDHAASRVHILDLYWKFDYGLGPRLPSIYTEGEFVHIRGRSNTISLAGGCDNGEGEADLGICDETNANIWGGAMRVGVRQNGKYGALLEWGFASGDGELFNDPNLSVRPLHPDYHIGLLMYQVALSSITAIRLGEEIRPLWSRGGVWNSQYFFPQVRYTITPGVEVHGAYLVAWARELLDSVLGNPRDDFTDTACTFESECFLGHEVDVALRVKWGQNDILMWDTEMGVMFAGPALRRDRIGLSRRILWTIQTRIAMKF